METTIFSAGLLMALGFLGGKAVGIIKLPSITGYLLIGLLIGPSVFNVVTPDNLSQLSHVVTPVVLGVIAYMIGGSLRLSSLSGLKRNILVITAFESGFAWLFALLLITFLAPILLPALSLDFKTALTAGIVIGGISLATAPAVTMAIIDELKVKGPLPTTLLGVVALDDALAIMAFAISIGVGAAIVEKEFRIVRGSCDARHARGQWFESTTAHHLFERAFRSCLDPPLNSSFVLTRLAEFCYFHRPY